MDVDRAGGVVSKRALDSAGARRLATEAAALRALEGSPAVARLLSFDGETLETAWVEAPSLLSWAPAANPEARAGFAKALVEAVRAMHLRGVAHRDLAPDNVLVAGPSQPVLIDFELARMAGHAHGGGTPATAAPELRWLPDPRLVDRRADTYSLGVMLRWLLADGPLGVAGDRLVNALIAPATARGADLAGWFGAMTDPRRSRRPADLDGLLATLGGAPVAPEPAHATLPSAATRALAELEEDVGGPASGAVREDLLELAPLDGLADEIPEASWAAWSRDLARAHALRARGDEPYQVAELELACGLPWRILAGGGGPAADLAARLDAPVAARGLLGSPDAHVGDPVALALAASCEAALGDLPAASRALATALTDARPLHMSAAAAYWRAVARVLYHAGALPDVIRIVLALPHGERGVALGALTPALGDLARRADSERRRHARRATALRGLVSVALGTTVLQAALVLGELCLWRVGARRADERVLFELSEAGRLATDTSPGVTGPVLSAVAAHQRRDAAGVEAARAEAQRRGQPLPPLPLEADGAAWARSALSPAMDVVPSWADPSEDDADPFSSGAPAPDASGEAPRPRPDALATLGRDGLTASIAHLERDLAAAPRDAQLWTLALQIWATRSATDAAEYRREAEVLIDALAEAGMPPVALLPWRMSARALAKDPAGALRVLAEQARHVQPLWPAWWLAARCWLDLGDAARAAEAVERMDQAGAPEVMMTRAREGLARRRERGA